MAKNRTLEIVNLSWNKIQEREIGDNEKVVIKDLQDFVKKNKNI